MHSYVLDVRTDTPHFPGIGRYVRNLASSLPTNLQEDERLVLLTAGDRHFALTQGASAGSHVVSVSTKPSPFSLSQQWAIPRLVRERRAALRTRVLYHSPYYLMPYAVPCPTVLTFYDAIALTRPEGVSVQARALFRFLVTLALKTTDRVITISELARRDLFSNFDVNPDAVTTIHLAAEDRFRPRPLPEQQSVRNALGLHGDFLLYVGSNKPHKNLARLVDAYARLRTTWLDDSLRPPRLVIAGAWDDSFPEAKARATIHNLGDAVRFLGPVDDGHLPALYSAAMVFVFPSHYEGFGLPVLEAMACGTPVVCSHASSLPEVAGGAAFYCDPENTESIAQAMRVVVADEALRRNLAELGLRRAQSFSWSRTAAATLDVYRSLMQRGN